VSQDTVRRRVDIWQHASGATSVVVGGVVPAVGLILVDYHHQHHLHPKLFAHFVEEMELVFHMALVQLLMPVVAAGIEWEQAVLERG